MNYIDEDTAFERWCENNYLPIESQAIWKKLFKRFNRSGWSEWVTVDNLTLMADVQIKHEKTFIGYRDKLIEVGLIQYIKGKKGSPNKYKLVSFFGNTSKNEAHSTVETTVYPTVETTVNSTDITKHKPNKTKQDYNINSSVFSSCENSEADKPSPKKTINKKDDQKHKYGMYSNVLLSDEDINKLRIEFPGDWEIRIERLSEYIASKGAKYASHLATIRKWARNDIDRANQKTKNVLNKEYKDFDEVFGNGN